MPFQFQYFNSLTVREARYFNIFDNIPYKYVKEIITADDEDEFDVEITDLPCDRAAYCKVSFKFKLAAAIGQREFTVELEYNVCSGYAMALMEMREILCNDCGSTYKQDEGEWHEDVFRCKCCEEGDA
jgi:hypothetical protein